jgi:rubrerythrin
MEKNVIVSFISNPKHMSYCPACGYMHDTTNKCPACGHVHKDNVVAHSTLQDSNDLYTWLAS